VSLPTKARIYIYSLGLLALAAIGYYSCGLAFTSVAQIVSFVLFITLGFLSEVYATWIPVFGGEISSSLAIYLASLFILGPSLTVVIVLFAPLASEVLMRWAYLKEQPARFFHTVSFNVAQLVVTISVTGLLLILTHHVPITLASVEDYQSFPGSRDYLTN
jgi:hypothetical protein